METKDNPVSFCMSKCCQQHPLMGSTGGGWPATAFQICLFRTYKMLIKINAFWLLLPPNLFECFLKHLSSQGWEKWNEEEMPTWACLPLPISPSMPSPFPCGMLSLTTTARTSHSFCFSLFFPKEPLQTFYFPNLGSFRRLISPLLLHIPSFLPTHDVALSNIFLTS